VQIKVLVVRFVNIVSATQQQLNRQARGMNPQFTITTAKTPVQISDVVSSSSPDGTNLVITLNATGQTVPYIDTNALSSYLTGKTEDQARNGISSGDAGIHGVLTVNITFFPSFLRLMPFRPEHIHIVVWPGS